jgi:tetratricopeptide (TPR) repeat protein
MQSNSSNPLTMNKIFSLLLLLLASSCYRVPDSIDPHVSWQLQDRHLQGLESAFAPLTPEEKATDWSKECLIASGFARALDLYRAISTYKRAEILIPGAETQRRLEIQYDILFCYFLGKKYDEAIEAFEKSDLAHVDKTFPAYHDLLLVLYECYREMDNPEKQERIYELMVKSFPDSAEQLQLSRAIREGELAEVDLFAAMFNGPSYLSSLLETYDEGKKSVGWAQTLNAFIPGAGYLYIGQKKSAFTAFFLNALFITAAYEFFHHGHTAGGIITLGFETGWYFGGIYGAGEEAKYYNERLYEKTASASLNERKLFPVLMLEHSF